MKWFKDQLNKRINQISWFVLISFVLAGLAWAAYTDIHGALYIHAQTDDSYLIYSDNSSGVNKFSVDTSGNVVAAGTLSATTITGTATEFGTGTVSGTEQANVTREIFYFPMAGWALDGGADIDESTAPEMGDADNVPAIKWDNSGETGAIQQTFRLPSTYVSGLALYCLVSSDTDVGTAGILDWQIWVNNDGVAFDAAAITQTQAAMGTASDPNVSNEVLTLTLDATGEAALTAGTWVTVDLFNATTHATGNLELKGCVAVGVLSE